MFVKEKLAVYIKMGFAFYMFTETSVQELRKWGHRLQEDSWQPCNIFWDMSGGKHWV